MRQDEALTQTNEMLSAMERQDIPGLADLARRLAELARETGFTKVADAAESLERAATAPGPKMLSPDFHRLSVTVARLSAELDRAA